MLLSVLLLAAYTTFFRLDARDWTWDEVIYRDAGLEYVQAGDFSNNQEHPFLVKYILGATQVVFGSSEAAVVRIPAATANLLTGLILFAFARQVVGYWAGVLALALWTVSPLTLTFGRYAMLEVFLMFFSTLAVYLGWRWSETRSRWLATFAGVAVGLATASKIVGILFLPAILLVGLLKMGFSRRLMLQSMLVGLAAATTVFATYAPAGSAASSAVQYMFEFQSQHNAVGHLVTVDGVPYQFPPWWTLLWWQWETYGTLASLSIGAAFIGTVLRHRPLDLYLLAAGLVPFLFLSFYSQVKLFHYFSAWQPLLILMLALISGKLLAQQRIIKGIFAVLLLAPFVYLGVQTVQDVSQVQPGPYTAAAEYLKDTGFDKGSILVWGAGPVVQATLPEAKVNPRLALEEQIEVLFIETDFSSYVPNRQIERFLARNEDRFENTYSNDGVAIYTRKPDG